MMIRLSDHLEHLAEYADTSREVKLIRTVAYSQLPAKFSVLA